jgi:hypothetical protein
MKHCTKCGQDKPADLDHFHSNAARTDGLNQYCKPCKIAMKNDWKARNRDKVLKQGERRRERILGPMREARAAARARAVSARSAWLEDNAQLVADIEAWDNDVRPVSFIDTSKQDRVAEYMAKHGVCAATARIQVRDDVKWKFYSLREVRRALRGRKPGNANRAWASLPFSVDELREHLSALFADGMTFDNQGQAWELDHIVPQSALPYDCPEHPNFAKVWALSNLRPVTKEENGRKGRATTNRMISEC